MIDGIENWKPDGYSEECMSHGECECGEAMSDHYDEKKSPVEAKGDCSICKGWADDGRGGCCIFPASYWQPYCPYNKAVKR